MAKLVWQGLVGAYTSDKPYLLTRTTEVAGRNESSGRSENQFGTDGKKQIPIDSTLVRHSSTRFYRIFAPIHNYSFNLIILAIIDDCSTLTMGNHSIKP